MPCHSSSPARGRRCSSCDEDCRCGCQSNIYSLPWEILEKILEYEDPVTLLAVERTCRMLCVLVSTMWIKYCKARGWGKAPTPLCLGLGVGKHSVYSYDKAVELSTGENQMWRLLAVRSFLVQSKRCVYCRSCITNDLVLERCTLSHDVLLCSRCIQHFAIIVTHDMIHLLNNAGVDTSRMHFAFGPLLMSSFIKTIRSNDYDEKEILRQLQPRIGDLPRLPAIDQSSMSISLAATGFNSSGNDNSGINNGNICRLFDRQHGCSCAVAQCSTATPRATSSLSIEPVTQPLISPAIGNDTKLYAISFIVILCNIVQCSHSSVIVQDYKIINVGAESMAPFVLIAFINIALVGCLSAYVLWCILQRLFKHGWSRSYTTILQCFLLVCLLAEVNQMILTAVYVKNLKSTANDVFIKAIPVYNTSQSHRERINYIQGTFHCCGFTSNATRDWSIWNNNTATSSLPASCCSSDVSNGACDVTQKYSQSCPVAVHEVLFDMIEGFLCTTVCCGIAHLMLMLYIVLIVCRISSSVAQPGVSTASVQTMFSTV
eukprot:gene11978-13215_t